LSGQEAGSVARKLGVLTPQGWYIELPELQLLYTQCCHSII